jgi:hypothetical protein
VAGCGATKAPARRGAAYGRRCTAYTSHAALLVVRVCADGVTVVAAEEEHGRAWVRVRVRVRVRVGVKAGVRAEAEGESGG